MHAGAGVRPSFLGFHVAEVNVESKSFQCETRLCLANHFQGRVTCPYGQDSMGNAPAGAKFACFTPIGDPVNGIDPATGMVDDPSVGASVKPQCTDARRSRPCTARAGAPTSTGRRTTDANYCTCPKGFCCTQLVSSIGAADVGLTGAYCILSGTEYNPNNACGATCDPTAANCGNIQITTQ